MIAYWFYFWILILLSSLVISNYSLQFCVTYKFDKHSILVLVCVINENTE